jgi:hypothetical protein
VYCLPPKVKISCLINGITSSDVPVRHRSTYSMSKKIHTEIVQLALPELFFAVTGLLNIIVAAAVVAY